MSHRRTGGTVLALALVLAPALAGCSSEPEESAAELVDRARTTLLQVTAWRTPCANFARFWNVPDLVKRFSAHGATGAYLRVLETGELGAGDAVEVLSRPDHGITVETAFRIAVRERSRLPELVPALGFLPVKNQPKIAAKIERLTART